MTQLVTIQDVSVETASFGMWTSGTDGSCTAGHLSRTTSSEGPKLTSRCHAGLHWFPGKREVWGRWHPKLEVRLSVDTTAEGEPIITPRDQDSFSIPRQQVLLCRLATKTMEKKDGPEKGQEGRLATLTPSQADEQRLVSDEEQSCLLLRDWASLFPLREEEEAHASKFGVQTATCMQPDPAKREHTTWKYMAVSWRPDWMAITARKLKIPPIIKPVSFSLALSFVNSNTQNLGGSVLY